MVPFGTFRLSNSVAALRLGMPPVMTTAGRIHLTFDDGPVPEVTPWVLDELDRYQVKATFFMVGENARRYPHLVREVVRRGHVVANHTFHHCPGHKKSLGNYLYDIHKARLAVEAPFSLTHSMAEYAPERIAAGRIFRPPHGFLRMSQLIALRLHGYRVVLFDLVSRDYDRTLTPHEVSRNVLDNVRHGSIVVFHDSVKAFPRLKEALPAVLDALVRTDRRQTSGEHEPQVADVQPVR